jgi:hypothetical protein
MDVVDEFAPWNAGRWKLSNGSCERTEDEADLRCDVTTVGSVYLGGFSFRQLFRAFRVEELRDGAIDRADAIFGRAGVAPWCPDLLRYAAPLHASGQRTSLRARVRAARVCTPLGGRRDSAVT